MTQHRGRSISRTAAAGLVVGALISAIPLLAPPPAVAHSDPSLIVRLVEIAPDLPDGVDLSVLDGERTYLQLANPGTEPVSVLDPQGTPFLVVSADGVFGDLDSSFLAAPYSSATGTQKEVDLACCPDGTWARLSGGPSWIWADPRLDPPLRDPDSDTSRGLGRMSSDEPLGSWEIDFGYGDGLFTAHGDVIRRYVGSVSTTIDDEPDGLRATVVESRPPQIRVEFARGSRFEVLGDSGQPFLRVGPTGAFALASSPEYIAHRQAVGLPPQTERGWVPVAGATATSVTWGDLRLNYEAVLPDEAAPHDSFVINEWSIPVAIGGEKQQISGRATWKPAPPPPPLEPVPPGDGFWGDGTRTTYLIAAGLTGLVVVALAISRASRRSAARELE